jgi:SAM-dependent methyltransferase
MHEGRPWWEDPGSVRKFADRDPSVRLRQLIANDPDPTRMRVLDLGCAGGRNTMMLAARGYDVHARDASAAMVSHTRERLTEVLGAVEAQRRVKFGRMHDLGDFADSSVDLIVALGIYHCAADREEWEAALAESARILAPGGRLLVAVFAPEIHVLGEPARPLPGVKFLVDAETLDSAMARVGLTTVEPSTVSHAVIHALYGATSRSAPSPT